MGPVWKSRVFTQPAAIKIAADWRVRTRRLRSLTPAIIHLRVSDRRAKRETGHYGWGRQLHGLRRFRDIGFRHGGPRVSIPWLSGDGSFMMNPQVLIDAVQHRQRCILLLDNRRMSAISALQVAQYGVDFATNDAVEVDYVALAGAVGEFSLHGGNDKNSLLARWIKL